MKTEKEFYDDSMGPLGGKLPLGDEQLKYLTKREYFAAIAMQGLLSDPNYTSSQGQGKDNEAKLAEFSVKYADALLKELEK